jgi:GNAT superfamily N-acetyltransferase
VVIPPYANILRPYALIENVVTDEAYRKRGLATACLSYAKELAIRENCYKLMLMTGSKLESTLKFYENAGYNRHDKTAFIQWLDA